MRFGIIVFSDPLLSTGGKRKEEGITGVPVAINGDYNLFSEKRIKKKNNYVRHV